MEIKTKEEEDLEVEEEDLEEEDLDLEEEEQEEEDLEEEIGEDLKKMKHQKEEVLLEEGYKRGYQDGVKECTARLKKVNDEFAKMDEEEER